jgi:hypothetical protein
MNLKNLLNPTHLYEHRRGYLQALKRSPHDIDHYLALRVLNTQKLKALKDKYRGERCFILGNGPSLKKHDLRLLIDEYTFVTNWFVLDEVFKELKKCFYCVCDPHFFNYGEGFHPELIEALRSNPRTIKFFEYLSYPSYKSLHPRLDNVLFVRMEPANKVWEGHFSTDIWKSTCWGKTVIIELCLPIAFYLGFRNVYLMGCDCDYKLDDNADFEQSFFYDISQTPQKDREHVQKQADEPRYNLPFWEASYRTVKLFFEQNGRKIFNAGKGGKLEVFDRVDYDHLFPETGQK